MSRGNCELINPCAQNTALELTFFDGLGTSKEKLPRRDEDYLRSRKMRYRKIVKPKSDFYIIHVQRLALKKSLKRF